MTSSVATTELKLLGKSVLTKRQETLKKKKMLRNLNTVVTRNNYLGIFKNFSFSFFFFQLIKYIFEVLYNTS